MISNSKEVYNKKGRSLTIFLDQSKLRVSYTAKHTLLNSLDQEFS
ncbi:hypothetical protein OENI_10222 [Oenococcus oeni]|nr:hypothetical protein OENI_10222 [Oenococcus oeni]